MSSTGTCVCGVIIHLHRPRQRSHADARRLPWYSRLCEQVASIGRVMKVRQRHKSVKIRLPCRLVPCWQDNDSRNGCRCFFFLCKVMLQKVCSKSMWRVHPDPLARQVGFKKRTRWGAKVSAMCIEALLITCSIHCERTVASGELLKLCPIEHPV